MSDPVRSVGFSQIVHSDSGFTPLYAVNDDNGRALECEPVKESAVANDLYAAGLSDGQEMAYAAFEAERAALLKLIAAADALQPEPSDELAVLIGESVAALVAQIVDNVEFDRPTLETRARQAAALVAECDAARTIWVHPDDAMLLRDAGLPLDVHADSDMDRGSIRIDCSAGWIEHGTALYLDRLRLELGLDVHSA